MKGQPFVKNGKTLLSHEPHRRAERIADAVPVSDKTLYFCPSPLYGYGLERLLSRLENTPDSAVLCAEADPEIYNLSIENIPSLILHNKKFHITEASGGAELASAVRDKWGMSAFRRIEVVRLTGGWQLHAQLYSSLCDTLRREIANDWSNAFTLAKLGRLYIRNFFRNLALVPQFPSIAELSFGSAPVLVLGAGPTLDEILDAAGNPVNRNFKIICVDTCIGSLKDRGIIPDLVVILESQHWNLRDFTGCYGWNVPSAVDMSALPSSARLLGGLGYLFFTPWTQLKVFGRLKKIGLLPAVIPPLGSVGLTAVEIARRLTSGKIICAGLDFSFTCDKFHARGTPGHRTRLRTQTRLQSLINNAAFASGVFSAVSKLGVSVYTNPAMKNYRDLFEREFSEDKRVFDIEGSGLSLGVKTLSLKEAINELGIKNFTAENTEEKKERFNSDLQLFLNDERKNLKELRNILTGDIEMDKDRLNVLLDECDYLWAHFPDCSGGRHPDFEDVSFLKRVRMEIDPMLKLM